MVCHGHQSGNVADAAPRDAVLAEDVGVDVLLHLAVPLIVGHPACSGFANISLNDLTNIIKSDRSVVPLSINKNLTNIYKKQELNSSETRCT
jgi:hypothetical protein